MVFCYVCGRALWNISSLLLILEGKLLQTPKQSRANACSMILLCTQKAPFLLVCFSSNSVSFYPLSYTVYENHPKMSHFAPIGFELLYFESIKYGTIYVKQTMKNETFIVVFEHCAFVLSKVLSHGYSLKCHDVETRLHTWTFGSSRLVAKQKRNSIPDSSSGSK